MEENLSPKIFGHERLIGRRVIFVLPVLLIVMIGIFLYFALPLRYFFSVKGGELCLMAGRLSWVDAQQCQSLDAIPARDLNNLESLTKDVFESRSDAMKAMRSFFLNHAEEQHRKVSALEHELSAPYGLLLRDLKAAQAAGAEGLEKHIGVLQGWMDLYKEKGGAK